MLHHAIKLNHIHPLDFYPQVCARTFCKSWNDHYLQPNELAADYLYLLEVCHQFCYWSIHRTTARGISPSKRFLPRRILLILQHIVQVSFVKVIVHNVQWYEHIKLLSWIIWQGVWSNIMRNSRGDRLTIYDSMHLDTQSSQMTICGSNPPQQIASRSNKILLNFQSDSRLGDAGFRIKIERGK